MIKLILSLALVSTISFSRPSQAAVGAVLLNAPVALVGLAIVGGSVVVFKNADPRDWDTQLWAAAGFIAGASVLGGEQEMTFGQITQNEADALKLTALEFERYNSELDQVNMVYSMVNDALLDMKNPTASDAAKLWKSAQGLVSPETFSAMLKITLQ